MTWQPEIESRPAKTLIFLAFRGLVHHRARANPQPIRNQTSCDTGHQFEGVKIRKFCSRPCQQKADYERNAETYRVLRMEGYYRQKKVVGKK